MAASARTCGIAAALMLALGLTACTTGNDSPTPTGPVVQLGAPGEENRTLSPEAVTMTEWVDERTTDRDLRLLAERMRISQEDEIEFMVRWLQDRGTPLQGDHSDHAAGMMPGMLTEEQLEELEAATGEDFERLFLQSMIQHHAGALEMVADLRAAGGGMEIAVGRFANDVEGDQGIEISRMQQMLAELGS